jgi:hypothetical protein
MIGIFSCSLDELQPAISQTQPVYLQLNAGSPRSLFDIFEKKKNWKF